MSFAASNTTGLHLAVVRAFCDQAPIEPNRFARNYRAWLAHYYNLLIPAGASVLEIGCGSGELLVRLNARRKVGVDLSERQNAAARARLPRAEFYVQAGEELCLSEQFDYIVISDTLDLSADVQSLLEQLHSVAHADTRLLINFHSNLWRPLLSFGRWCRLKWDEPQSNWLASSDLKNLLALSRWSPLTFQGCLLAPAWYFGLERLLNRWIAPFIGWSCLTAFCVARRTERTEHRSLSVSVVIPACNEAGNIAAAVARTPQMGTGTELMFVEGPFRDDTWAEIQPVAAAHLWLKIKTLQKSGRGEGDAVRLDFAAATGDIPMILEGDLTMPPEKLPKFYEVLASGRAKFANGCRLVYPMGEKAMQFLNFCANRTFGLIFTWVLGQPVKSTLCGTKVMARAHYRGIAANHSYLGDFDPFGDFDLLFCAAKLNLKIADVPIHYRERTTDRPMFNAGRAVNGCSAWSSSQHAN